MNQRHMNTLRRHQQLDLFGGASLAIDRGFESAERLHLDAHSSLEVARGWLSGSEALLNSLLEKVPFEQQQRWMYTEFVDEPRLTASYPDIAKVPEPFLIEIAAALSTRYGVAYDGLWINLYRDERDSTGWHTDRFSCKRDRCVVPVLSLGAPRRFLIQPRSGGKSTVVLPASGDLIVMSGRCQRDWQHSVPKQSSPAGVRISLNFQSTSQMISESDAD